MSLHETRGWWNKKKKKRRVSTVHRCILRCLTLLGFEVSKFHACVEWSIKPQKNYFLFVTLGTKKNLESWAEVRLEIDNKEEQECCSFSSSGDESVSAIESDDHAHLSSEHCHTCCRRLSRATASAMFSTTSS